MMQRYRAAFFVTLFGTIVLAGAVGFLWLRLHERDSMAGMASPAGGQPAEKPASSPPASGELSSAEAKLAPVTLTPERTQSIGVKTETVDYKQINDEILTTGNVEADETRLA